MYLGEVNVPQEELEEFLGAAQDLKIKGLTQGHEEEEDVKPKIIDGGPPEASPAPLAPSAASKRPAAPPPASSAGPSQAKQRRPMPSQLARTLPAATAVEPEVQVVDETKPEPSTSRIPSMHGGVDNDGSGGGYDEPGGRSGGGGGGGDEYEEYEAYDEDGGGGDYGDGHAGGTGDDAAKGRQAITLFITFRCRNPCSKSGQGDRQDLQLKWSFTYLSRGHLH